MDWIQVIVSTICAIVGAFGGASILTLKQQRQLKNVEVVHNQADEWKRLYDEADGERKSLIEKNETLLQESRAKDEDIVKYKLEIQKLRWYHCTVDNCKNRRPPHVFDANGTELANGKE